MVISFRCVDSHKIVSNPNMFHWGWLLQGICRPPLVKRPIGHQWRPLGPSTPKREGGTVWPQGTQRLSWYVICKESKTRAPQGHPQTPMGPSGLHCVDGPSSRHWWSIGLLTSGGLQIPWKSQPLRNMLGLVTILWPFDFIWSNFKLFVNKRYMFYI